MKEATRSKRTLTEKFTYTFERWMPDSMTIAFVLVLVTAVLAKIFTGAPVFVSEGSRLSIADSMAKNFWNLLAFSMQMVLITVLGNVFASSPPMKKVLQKFCALPKSTLSAYISCAMIGAALSWFHWAVGWMGCIVIGKEMLIQAKERGIKIHAPSFVAAVFCTALVAGSGIAASPVLFASTPGYLKTLTDPATAAMMQESYSVVSTAIYPASIITVILSCVIVLGLILAMRPKNPDHIEEITEEQKKFYSITVETKATDVSTPAKRLANSIVLQYIVVAFMGCWCAQMLMNQGFMGISINSYNYLVLTITLAVCMRPRIFSELFINTIQSAWAFVIQYPFYAGIFGIIVGTGFDKVIAEFFLSFATKESWPSIAMLYSAILNIFVPSGGSKFIIEAPYILPVTLELGQRVETIVMAYSYGDCATNMLTPFWWVLPCGLFKMDYHRVLPYAFVASILVTLFYFTALFFW